MRTAILPRRQNRAGEIAARALRLFWPEAWAVAGAVAFCLVVLAGVRVYHRNAEVQALRSEVCAARLEALKARHPFVRGYLLPADPCLAVSIAVQETTR